MYLTLPFTLEHQDEETATYTEQVASGRTPVLGTLVIKKSVLTPTPPAVMRITLSYHAETSAPAEPRGSTRPPLDSGDQAPKVGDAVTVVKSRLTTPTSPPEWLGQYLGRTGTVLWTTPAGAMVEFADSRAWFPYVELERENPEKP